MKPVRIVKHETHKGMYRLEWADGTRSVKYYDPENPMKDGGPNSYGFYNKTRALDILKNYDSYLLEQNAPPASLDDC